VNSDTRYAAEVCQGREPLVFVLTPLGTSFLWSSAFVLTSNRLTDRKGGVWKLTELSEPNDIGNAEDKEVGTGASALHHLSNIEVTTDTWRKLLKVRSVQ
jgi:hypothetical protein